MKTILVTGSRGFLGEQLALRLASQGYEVRAMLRPGSKTPASFQSNESIQPVFAQLEDLDAMEKAIEGVSGIFHLAAFAKPWAKDNRIFEQVNTIGTVELTRLTIKHGVKDLIITSTAGTFGPQTDNHLISESKVLSAPLTTEYEKTKKAGTDQAIELARESNLRLVAVSPTRVFGPGELSVSNAVTQLIHDYAYKGFRFVPGKGNTIGNYVFIDDIINGHLAAFEKGRSGENYILGGENLSYNAFYDLIGKSTGKRHRLIGVPIGLMLAVSGIMKLIANLTGNPPKITPPFVRKYTKNWGTSVEKAKSELGYTVTPTAEAISKTLAWLASKKK